MREPSIRQLIKRISKGDHEAVRVVFDMYKDSIYYFAIHYVKTAQDAEDIVQETFVEMLKSINSLKKPDSFKSWIMKIAYYNCMAVIKKRAKRQETAIDDNYDYCMDLSEENEEFLPGKALVLEETNHAITDMVKRLPAEQKTAVLLFYYQGLSVKDIANIVGCSEGTIKSRLNYARQSIKKKVNELIKNGVVMMSILPTQIITKVLMNDALNYTIDTQMSNELFQKTLEKVGMLAIPLGIGGVIAASSGASVSTIAVEKVIAGIAAVAVVAGASTYVALSPVSGGTNEEPSPTSITRTYSEQHADPSVNSDTQSNKPTNDIAVDTAHQSKEGTEGSAKHTASLNIGNGSKTAHEKTETSGAVLTPLGTEESKQSLEPPSEQPPPAEPDSKLLPGSTSAGNRPPDAIDTETPPNDNKVSPADPPVNEITALTITVGSEQCNQGETVSIPVIITNNPGMATFTIHLSYDNTKLTPVSISKGAALTSGDITSNIQSNALSELNYISAFWVNPSNVNENGNIYNVSFKVNDDAPPGITSITATSCKIANQSYNKVSTDLLNGTIKIINK